MNPREESRDYQMGQSAWRPMHVFADVPRLPPLLDGMGSMTAGARSATLVERCKTGDREALGELYRLYRQRVLRVVRLTLGGGPMSTDAEDVAHNAFMEIFRSMPTLRDEASLTSWICRISVHVSLRHARWRKVRAVLGLEGRLEPEAPASAGRPDIDAANRDMAGHLMDVLQKVRTPKRMAFLLHEIDGMPVEEVAETLGVPVGTVKSRLFHARKEILDLVRKRKLMEVGR